MPSERLLRPPGFDPEKAPQCGNLICGTGNGSLPPEKRMCTYMEQTNPFEDGTVTGAELATQPEWAGWLRAHCPFGEDVFEFRTKE